ncbi:TraB/GumN family protein [Pseudohoeflea sp. DP4N28-3]|uniref:TraB/GumN family protein n=2 Tax=Pseudohoeflea coraliihabitans TaxID=2860393 RepID=A0ABS6WLD3_9HYPH|nr:TraB/GumN family protein [Pseudohoeflea sp. DP4N28-3]
MRLPQLFLALAALVPLVLLAALFAAMIIAPARAENAVRCEGTSLLTRWQVEDRARFAAAQRQAAAVINGQNRFWKIEKEGLEPSWLFGTMHLTDPRVTAIPAIIQQPLDKARTVVIETDEILDAAKAQIALFAKPELTMFTDGSTLERYLEPDELALLKGALQRRGVQYALVAQMKPWIIASMVGLPDCERINQRAGVDFLDKKIALEARAAGKVVRGLETLDEQLSAMASLPIDFHVDGLVSTLRLNDQMPDIIATMTDLYLSGDIAMILPAVMLASPEDGAQSAASYGQFEERMITLRNKVMAERAAPMLAEGHVFVAVGALHLPGDDGLVALLRDAGYRLTPVD